MVAPSSASITFSCITHDFSSLVPVRAEREYAVYIRGILRVCDMRSQKRQGLHLTIGKREYGYQSGTLPTREVSTKRSHFYKVEFVAVERSLFHLTIQYIKGFIGKATGRMLAKWRPVRRRRSSGRCRRWVVPQFFIRTYHLSLIIKADSNKYHIRLKQASTRLHIPPRLNRIVEIRSQRFAVDFQYLFSGHATPDDSGNVVVPHVIMGVFVLLIAVVFAFVKLPEIRHADDDAARSSGDGNLRRLWRQPLFVFGLAALLAYEVAEISINSYFINFVTGQHWMTDSAAANVITAALFIFMIGRFVGSFIMRRVAAEKTLLVWAVGTVACMLLVLADIEGVSLCALIANYLFEAIMFPTIFSLTLRGLGTLTKSASSVLMMTPVGGCGFLLMGMIADNSNLIMPFVIPLVGFAIVLLFAAKLVRDGRAAHNA